MVEEVTLKLARLEQVDEETIEVADPNEDARLRAEKEQAVTEMWDWYKEWSQIARTVVKNRNYQVLLGLRSPSRQHSTDEDSPAELGEAASAQ